MKKILLLISLVLFISANCFARDLEDWEIKAMEWQLKDYQEWVDHVNNYEKFDGREDEIIQNKINKCAERMINRYKELPALEGKITIEEKVNTISSDKDYKNRAERDAEFDNL